MPPAVGSTRDWTQTLSSSVREEGTRDGLWLGRTSCVRVMRVSVLVWLAFHCTFSHCTLLPHCSLAPIHVVFFFLNSRTRLHGCICSMAFNHSLMEAFVHTITHIHSLSRSLMQPNHSLDARWLTCISYALVHSTQLDQLRHSCSLVCAFRPPSGGRADQQTRDGELILVDVTPAPDPKHVTATPVSRVSGENTARMHALKVRTRYMRPGMGNVCVSIASNRVSIASNQR